MANLIKTSMPDKTPSPSAEPPAQALLADVAVMLAPLVRWLLDSGVPLGALVETLKSVYLAEARDDLTRRGRKVTDSALSVLTGVHRKEVKALMGAHPGPDLGGARAALARVMPTPAVLLFTRWITDARFRVDHHLRRDIPRHGPMPSFEALAREVSSDVHPRTLLEELQRLGLVKVQSDSVLLLNDRFVVPCGDPLAVQTMAVNVSDHIAAATNNLRARVPEERLLEQSVFASGLSPEGAAALGELARQLWAPMLDSMVQAAQASLSDNAVAAAAQEAAAPGRQVRMRLGVYYYMEPHPEPPATRPTGKPARRTRKDKGD